MASSTTHTDPIYSSFGADPLLGELVEMYVAEMPDRIAALEQALAAENLDGLRRTAHQMKGAAGSYGFDCLTTAAGSLEAAIKEKQTLDQIEQSLDELTRLCRRIRRGSPN
jgi:HPt (histidine-containing phosphotransfer) domain-containing protein